MWEWIRMKKLRAWNNENNGDRCFGTHVNKYLLIIINVI